MMLRLLLVFLVLCVPVPALSGPVTLLSLDWAPFVGRELPQQGTITPFVRRVFAAAEVDAQLLFVPWKRVLQDVRAGQAVGYFPEYRSVQREREFIYSRPIGCSVVGLVQRQDSPVSWEQVADLGRYAIGVVDGYVNSDEFDRLVASGKIQPVKCRDDRTALRMLAMKRLDAVVMDRDVFSWLGRTRDDEAKTASLIFDEHILAVHTLHVCFRRTPEGRRLADRFEQAAESLQDKSVLCAP